MPEAQAGAPPLLSICVATFSRARFIAETLENILAQATPAVEVLVVDGASPDDTEQVVRAVQARHPALVYHREAVNSGVDRDFDKAVGYARGTYCWLMSDDDLLAPGAVARVLDAIADGPDLVVVNAEVRDKTLEHIVRPSMMALREDRTFGPDEAEALFAEAGAYLTFIGGVVVRKEVWMARERERYYGSLFIHVGVLFQTPLAGRAKVIAAPLVRIRYGNAMWTARGFEIWIDKWPGLIWSFGHFSAAARERVTEQHPATYLQKLFWYRALGAYGPKEYDALLAGGRRPAHALARAVTWVPARAVNALVSLYAVLGGNPDRDMILFELRMARCASWLARALSPRSGAAR